MDQPKALVYKGMPGHLDLVQFPKPVIASDEILVRVEAATICGSDVHTIHKRRQVAVPTILGHEILGSIEILGENAHQLDARGERLEKGDRIVWAVVAHCGCCELCTTGLTQKCSRATKYGHEKVDEFHRWNGGFGEWCVLAPGTTIIRVPKEAPATLLCPASCATATVFSAMEAAANLQGKSVLIAGAGLLGATAILVSKSLGAKQVIVIDPLECRKTIAMELGADRAFSPTEFCRESERSEFGVFFEFSGSNEAWQLGVDLLATGGVAVLVGSVFPAPDIQISLEKIVRKMWTIRGIHNYGPRHLIQAVDFLTQSEIASKLADLVGPWFSMEQHKEALNAAAKPEIYRAGFLMSGK